MANVPYSQVPTVEPTSGGSGAGYQSVPEANPAAFGAQIGEAEQKLGQTGQELGEKTLNVADEFAKMATTSKAENDFATQYATGAAKLRQNFDMLDDKDKIKGSVDYINGLNNLQQNFTGEKAQGGPYYKQLMSQLIGRHIFSETSGINREVVNSTMNLSAQSKMAVIATNNGYAAANFNNPEVVDQMHQSNAGLRTIQAIDAGHDPTTPEGAAIIEEYQRNDTASMADGMVKSAVASGDIASAMRIRGTYNNAIPGYQQLQQDTLIHTASMQQFGSSGVSALAAGQPIPQIAGAPAASVQAIVANTAHTSGVDPNDALTVARIESSMGTNVGSRGTIGQDRGSSGQPLDAQAKALCDNWKAAHDPAVNALGREPQGWEQYVVYQQGTGGGAALLKADPNARAVDILRPLYTNQKDALSAVTNNGGNASMTVSDFLDQEKKRWTDQSARAKCDFTGDVPPGDQILVAHQTPGITVQPAANPMQDYRNWQKANILNIQQIMAMPSGPGRDALLRENQFQTGKREAGANIYKSELSQQAYQYMADPKITDMKQIPPEFAASLFEVNPIGFTTLQNRIRENAERSDPATKEALEKGPAFHELNVGTQQGSTTPTTTDMVNQSYNDGKINSTAQDYLLSKISGKRSISPDEATYKKNSLEYAESRINPVGKTDPDGLAHYSDFSMAFDNYVDQAKAKGTPLHEIYSSKNIDGIIKQFEPDYNSSMPQPKNESPSLFSRMFGSSSTTNKLSLPKREDLVIGKVYSLPNHGNATWTGTGFIPVSQGAP